MKIVLDNYIQSLFEINNNKTRSLNAPEFAFYTLYGYVPTSGIRGKGENHRKKNVEGIEIDEHIPSSTIKELFKIPDIEMRSSCQGTSKNRPSFIIFRPKKQNKKYVKKLVDKLNKYDDIKSGYDIGKQNKFRICITGYTWYGKKDNTFEKLNNLFCSNNWGYCIRYSNTVLLFTWRIIINAY